MKKYAPFDALTFPAQILLIPVTIPEPMVIFLYLRPEIGDLSFTIFPCPGKLLLFLDGT